MTLETTAVAELASGLVGEFQLVPLLQKILNSAVALLECHSGSICIIDPDGLTYRKEVDLGVECQAGRRFPLNEGVTGEVRRAGGFVMFHRYAAVPNGHIEPRDRRYNSPVIGVPLYHRGEMIGTFVVFGMPGGREFEPRDAAVLAQFGIHASIAIVNSRLHRAALAQAVADALDHAPHRGPELQAAQPLTARENEVLQLVIRGLPDKHMASMLGISAKTVEKHVGTILRKTGARNRTMLAGWSDRRALGPAAGHGGNPA